MLACMQHSHAYQLALALQLKVAFFQPFGIQLSCSKCILADDHFLHRVPLAQVPEAFAMNLAYEDNVIKVVVDYG